MRVPLLLLFLLLAFSVACFAQSNDTDDGNVVSNTTIPIKTAPYQQHHKDVIGSITGVFGTILHILIFIFVYCKSENDTFKFFCVVFGFLGMIGFILFETEFFVNMWDTYVQRQFWDRETFIVKNTSVVYKTCAKVACNHGCQNLPPFPNVDSCGFMQAILRSGPCNGGYKCCNSVRVPYRCGTFQSPATCYRTVCVSSVDSLWCDVIVGLCADVQAQVYYQSGNVQYNTVYHQHCGLNDSRCVSNLLNKYVPGFTFRASINPEAPAILVENISYRENELTGMIFGVAFLCLAYLFLFSKFLYWAFDENYDNVYEFFCTCPSWPSWPSWPSMPSFCHLSYWRNNDGRPPVYDVNNNINDGRPSAPPAYSLYPPTENNESTA